MKGGVSPHTVLIPLVTTLLCCGLQTSGAHIKKDDKPRPVKISFAKEVIDVREGESAGIHLVAEGLSGTSFNGSITVKIGFMSDTNKYSKLSQAKPVGPELNIGDFVVNFDNFEEHFTVEFSGSSDHSSVHHIWTVEDNLYEGTESALFRILEVDVPVDYVGKVDRERSSKLCVNILDDDAVEVSFEKEAITVAEGKSVDIGAILRGSPVESPLSIGVICYRPLQSNIHTTYTAKKKADFIMDEDHSLVEFSQNLWKGGERRSSKNVTVMTTVNGDRERNETFVCTFRYLHLPTDPLRITEPDRIAVTIINS
jgi:hypothetical protein